MWERIEAGLRQRFRDHPAVKAQLDHTTEQVLQGQLPASTAARQLLELFN
jgi:LAO/AO transport system kinase